MLMVSVENWAEGCVIPTVEFRRVILFCTVL